MAIPDIIAAYDRAWNEPDAAVRRSLLETAWREDGELLEPRGAFRGRDAIIERVGGFQERFPGARVDISSGLDSHHGFVRYTWAMNDAQGQRLLDGIDVCQIADDGKLQRVVMFFGPLPGLD